ncbi:hypothetical protein [Hymenobacter cavernae]|uniref:Uncharacterized protein n=1 Tax=Hymenobacter cavernae TaxID=2044852 RepID=A0ABQ1TWQ0_9BACT|nr:hypothetical protein [Hymenobacter cavernae]GGF05680.1 hypothetical protein GCM10011383_15970 [Hymenobacter cavernae]
MYDPGFKKGTAYKFGELPVFGPHISNKLLKMVGADRGLFFKGRTCENQGLGIVAFAYYRRVVENQKNRILNEIVKVAEKIGSEEETIKQLKQAIQETQFTKALTMIKAALPQSLLINGHNPLALLHSALSEGLHGHSDEECLELATSVRVVLSELSERLAQALKDDSEVSKALQNLISKKSGK